MTAAYVVGYDAIRVNALSLPRGAQAYAGYATGTGPVPWPESLFAAYATPLGPCLRIDQDPYASDPTADYLDVEDGAATFADCPGWARRALADFKAGRRPGQRSPAIYMSASNVTPVVNALTGGGVTSGVGLVVANWSIMEGAAIADVANAAGPYPIVGVQFADPGPYDVNIFSRAWLLNQAGAQQPPPGPNWTETLVNELPGLAQGATGEDVKTMQGCLGARGHPVTIDGRFGPATRAAVEAFQVSRFLTPDGICGPLTWPKLLNR